MSSHSQASSSATMTAQHEEETSFKSQKGSKPGSRPPSQDQTEAHIMPDTADQSQEQDLEKAQLAAEREKPSMGLADPSSFPDGGIEAWRVVFGAFCALICSFGWINCIGVFQDYYQTTLLSQYSPSTVSWIPSLETFMMFLGGPIFGKLYDNYGPRYILLVGSFLHVFGLMMASLSTEYYQFILAQGIVSPIGASMIFYPALSATSTWFFHRRALAMGIMASGSSLGGVIFPILVQQLIPQIGFPWTMRVAAFLILFLLILANLTIKSRIPPNPKPVSLKEFILPLREPAFALVCAGSFLIFFGLFLPFNFIILQGEAVGMSKNLASYLLAILNGVSIIGRTLPGYLADRYGRFNIIALCTYFSGILILALWLPSRSSPAVILFAALYGFGSGAFVSMAPAVVAQISDIRQIGVRNGTLFAIISTAALFGNPIGGALLSSAGGGGRGKAAHADFSHLQIFAGVAIVAGSSLYVLARWTIVGWKLGVKV